MGFGPSPGDPNYESYRRRQQKISDFLDELGGKYNEERLEREQDDNGNDLKGGRVGPSPTCSETESFAFLFGLLIMLVVNLILAFKIACLLSFWILENIIDIGIGGFWIVFAIILVVVYYVEIVILVSLNEKRK